MASANSCVCLHLQGHAFEKTVFFLSRQKKQTRPARDRPARVRFFSYAHRADTLARIHPLDVVAWPEIDGKIFDPYIRNSPPKPQTICFHKLDTLRPFRLDAKRLLIKCHVCIRVMAFRARRNRGKTETNVATKRHSGTFVAKTVPLFSATYTYAHVGIRDALATAFARKTERRRNNRRNGRANTSKSSLP